MLDIHEELRLLCERQGEALKKLAAERDDARAQRDAAIETTAHIGRERDALKAAAEQAVEELVKVSRDYWREAHGYDVRFGNEARQRAVDNANRADNTLAALREALKGGA